MEKKKVIKYILNEQSLIENKKKPCTVVGCSSTFTSLSNLNMHLEKHHGVEIKKLIDKQTEVQYFCPVSNCKYNVLQKSPQHFKCRKYLRQHFLKVHAAKNEKCSKCNKSFANISLKAQHERICGMVFKCGDCDWEYTTRECLLTHCRRKGHKVPPKQSSLDEAKMTINRNPSQIDQHCQTESNESAPKTIRIATKPRSTDEANQANLLMKRVQLGLRSSPAAKIRANFQRILQKSRAISTKVSQTTQTSTIRMATKKVGDETMVSSDIHLNSDDKFKSLEFIDEESNSSAEDSTKANRNLNNLSYVEDESSLHYFTVNNFNAGLCHIETQTDLLPYEDSHIGSNEMDPLLCHMHTQTCDNYLTELGLADIQTQTNWHGDECNDIFVSAETQTCFDSNMMLENISTHTQTSIGINCDVRPSKWSSNIQHNSQFTQTLTEP